VSLSWEDKLQLQDLLVKYARALDYATEDNAEEFFETVTDDAVFESPLSGHYEGTAGLKTFYERALKASEKSFVRHHISNFTIHGDGDEAQVKAYLAEWIISKKPQPAGKHPMPELLFTGSYDCTARRVDGKWRMSRRRVIVDGR
jgi:hypothetical protein